VRTFMLGEHPAYLQSSYRWTPGAVPQLLHVAYLVDDTAHVAPTLRRASGVVIPATPATSTSPAQTHRTMLTLYQAMRDALARGDWVAFGRAFDALGALLGRTPP